MYTLPYVLEYACTLVRSAMHTSVASAALMLAYTTGYYTDLRT
jgi:hypothetical protein